MNKSKKVFFAVALIFILLMLYFAYDVSKKTTAPWNKQQIEERTSE